MEYLDDLIGEIKRGRIYPVYLLHGEEAYLIEDIVSEMIDILAPKNVRDFNLDIFSTPDVSVRELLSIADTYPVMAERRVVVVKDPAFLGSKNQVKAIDMFIESRELYRAGNLRKSASLIAHALDLSPNEFAEVGTAVRRAIEKFKKDNEDELSSDDLDFIEDNLESLAGEIDITSAFSSGDELDQLLEWIQEKPSPTTVLIIAVTSELTGSSKIVKAISRTGKVTNFSKFRPASYVNRDPMYQMVTSKLKEYKKAIAPNAFTELQKKTGNDMRQIFDELEKLITFIGDKERIEKTDVDELVARTDFDEIFDLTNAVGQRSLPLALANLKSILQKGEHPILIHTMLTRQVRFLLQVKLMIERGYLKQDISQQTNYDAFQKRVFKKIPEKLINELPEPKQLNILKQPYPLYITLRQAKNFTVDELIKCMVRLLEADIQLKTGRLTPELVVETLVMDLCSLPSN